MQLNYGIELLNGGQHWLGRGFYNQDNYNGWGTNERLSRLKTYWDSWPQSQQTAQPWFDPTTGNVNVATAGAVASLEAQSDQQMLLIWIITGVATFSVMLGLKRGIKQLAIASFTLG